MFFVSSSASSDPTSSFGALLLPSNCSLVVMGEGEEEEEEEGWEVISLISASISFVLMSLGEIFPFCDISVRVLVRSTRVSRPSEWERRRIVRDFCWVEGRRFVRGRLEGQ